MRVASECAVDVVLDTNVLSHADNGNAAEHATALAVLGWMDDSEVTWVLDDQGKNAPDPQTSVLYAEYRATLAPQGFAISVFIRCLGFGRVAFSPRPDREMRAKLRALVPANVKDQAVLGAAVGSTNKVLVSNDLRDFSPAVRATADSALDVLILDSGEAAA